MAAPTTKVPALDDALRLTGQLIYTLEQILEHGELDQVQGELDQVQGIYLLEAQRLAKNCEGLVALAKESI